MGPDFASPCSHISHSPPSAPSRRGGGSKIAGIFEGKRGEADEDRGLGTRGHLVAAKVGINTREEIPRLALEKAMDRGQCGYRNMAIESASLNERFV